MSWDCCRATEFEEVPCVTVEEWIRNERRGAVCQSQLNFSPDDTLLIEKYANASNLSIEEFTRKTTMKAIRNAEYLSKLDRAFKNREEGKSVMFSDEEWEQFVHEQGLR